MKKITALVVAFACISIAVLFSTCKKDGSTSAQLQSSVAVRLKDAPGHYDHVRLRLHGFRLFLANGQVITIPINDTTVDILELQDTSLLLSTVNIPAGTISEVSLLIDSIDTVTIGGVDFALKIDPRDSSDFILKISVPTAAGKSYTIVVDLDAANSIFGDNQHYGLYWLRPYLNGSWRRNG